MTGIDFAILGVLLSSILMGLWRGFTRELLGLFTWAGSAAATYFTLPLARGIARSHIANPQIADTLTVVVLFIVFLIIFSITSNIIASAIRNSTLGGIDRSLGLGFGILRGVILICIGEVILTAVTPRPSQGPSIQNARFIHFARRGGDTLMAIIPDNWREQLNTLALKPVDTQPKASPVGPDLSDQAQNILNLLDQQKNAPSSNHSSQQPGSPPSAPNAANPPHQGSAPSALGGVIVPHISPQATAAGVPTARSVPIPVEDPQKTAESLANLRPQAIDTKKEDADYDVRQRRDMDRLILNMAQGG